MKKRFLSLALVLVLALSLVACGSKSSDGKKSKAKDATSVKEVVESIETSTKDAEYKGVKIDVKYNDISLEVNSYGDVSKQELGADISVNGKAVTNLIVADEVAYINLKSLANWIDTTDVALVKEYKENFGLDELKVADVLEQYGLTKEYASLKLNDLEDLTSSLGGSYLDMVGLDADNLEGSANKDSVSKLVAALSKTVASVESEQAIKDAVSYDGQYCTVKLTEKNYAEVLDALAKADVADLVAAYAEVSGNDADQDLIDEAVEGFPEAIADAKEGIKEQFGSDPFTYTVGFGIKNDSLQVAASVDGKLEGKATKASFTLKTITKSQKVSVPKDSDDLENILGAFTE